MSDRCVLVGFILCVCTFTICCVRYLIATWIWSVWASNGGWPDLLKHADVSISTHRDTHTHTHTQAEPSDFGRLRAQFEVLRSSSAPYPVGGQFRSVVP